MAIKLTPSGEQNPDELSSIISYIEQLEESRNGIDYPFVENKQLLIDLFNNSYGQLFQDAFALWVAGFKRNGYFVEFGATNGIDISNTYLLEKQFYWNGILAEPAKAWHDDLFKNRSCNITTDCVWHSSNQTVCFDESSGLDGAFSSIKDYVDYSSERLMKYRGSSTYYDVNTISLNDLLEKYNAPVEIDYMSLDTEGSELDILKSFNFEKYRVKFLTVEHNDYLPGGPEYRQNLYDFITSKGYERVWVNFSRHDDWYILK